VRDVAFGCRQFLASTRELGPTPAPILPLPPVECLLGNPDLADQIGHRRAQLRLLLHRQNLLCRKPLSFHRLVSLQSKIRRISC
jgi:hypothetical protein